MRPWGGALDGLTSLSHACEVIRANAELEAAPALVAERGERIQPRELVPMCSLLREDPSLAAQTVEEVLRYDSPVQETARVSFEDTEIGGVGVRRNQWVVTLLGGANRDPSVFTDPGRFDITRAAGAERLASPAASPTASGPRWPGSRRRSPSRRWPSGSPGCGRRVAS